MLSIKMEGNSPLGFTSEAITLLLASINSMHNDSIMRKYYAQHQNEK